mgnify:CR=1 FL=1|jgi:chemotaxis protein histidine kinase CheA
MAPEIEETTQDAVETTPEAPPVTPEETGAEPVDAPPVNELSEFRAARKAERNGEVSDDAEEKPPAQEAATEESESIATETIDPDKHVYDPDTGEVLDRRTRAAKRIEVLLRERHLLRQQLAGQQPPSEVPAQTPAPEAQAAPAEEAEPTLEQFSQEADPYAAFMAANARWHARQEFQKQAAEQSTADRTAQVEARVQEAQSSWDGKLDEVRTRLPDFDKAYNHMYQALPTDGRQRPLVETLLTSPIGHDLAHYLGTNPKAVTDLYNQPTLKAHLRAIGKIEAQVEAQLSKGATPVSTPVDTPPPPMNPVGAGATPTNYNSSTATLAQFRKHNGVRGGRRNA